MVAEGVRTITPVRPDKSYAPPKAGDGFAGVGSHSLPRIASAGEARSAIRVVTAAASTPRTAAPAASPPVSSSGTTSGRPVRPRGTPATAIATIDAPAPSGDRHDRRSGAERDDHGRQQLECHHPPGVAGRAAEQPDGRELVAALGRSHRRRVDQRDGGERDDEADDQPDAPRPVDVGRVDRVEVLAAGQRPHAGMVGGVARQRPSGGRAAGDEQRAVGRDRGVASCDGWIEQHVSESDSSGQMS